MGWDSLVPELNFKLNIARSLSAVWQDYQGVGLLGGMGHAADLPRELLLWVFSFALPQSFLRYVWTFLMLAAGPLGTYFLISRVLVKDKGWAGSFAGFAGAVFYLFNLATVQTFYVPFETFTSFFGFFPWLLFFALGYLEDGGKRKILSFFLFSLLAVCAFYVQTLFVVYAIFLAVFAIEAIIRHKKSGLKRSTSLSFATLLSNSFWLLPVLYFTLTSGWIPGASHINSIATPETQYMNQARGNFNDIVQFKGYWFDYYDWFPQENTKGSYDYMYKNWIAYDQNPLVGKVSLALFVVSIAGLLLSLFGKQTVYGASLLVLAAVSYFFLAGANPPSGEVYQFLSGKIPLFADIFRNTFTKWAVPLALVVSMGLGYFVYCLAGFVKGKMKVFLSFVFSFSLVFAAVFTVLPVFSGNLISKSMEVNLPNSYLETVDYFKGVDHSQRIADFPLTDFWGWHFSSLGLPAGRQGYEGSGFLWYGIPQPMLDRTFDVWSPNNEGFYSEISRAVGARNSSELSYVLNKYQVSYILFDGNINEPANPDWPGQMSQQKDFLESSGLAHQVKQFDNIFIYKTNLQGGPNAFISTPESDYSGEYVAIGQMSQTPDIAETFPDNQGYSQAHNCDLKGQGNVAKKKIDGGNYYEADGGASSCDYFYYPTLDLSKAYKMRITGNNIAGRSLKFYLYDVSSRQNILEELLPSGSFDESYYIYPTAKEKSIGTRYTLNVETRSFGDIGSANAVTGIEFYPVDFGYLDNPISIVNNLKVTGVQKYGTWGYKVDAQGYGLMQLGQGYETGWKAFPTLNFQFTIFNLQLKLQLPDFKHELDHVKVNSWANGWLVGQSQSESVKTGQSQLKPASESAGFQPIPAGSKQFLTVYILFWPQILEWGGMAAAAITLLVLCFRPGSKSEN